MEADTDPQLHTSKKKKKTKLNVTIQTQNEQPGKLAPLVGYFPSGFDPTNNGSNPGNPPDIRVYRNQKRAKRLELVVSPNGSNVDFVGTNYSGEAAAGRMCSYALGVLDKETKKLKIVPIAANKIFRLEPRVRTTQKPDKEPVTPAKAELTVAERVEQLNSLTNLYGTKTAIKQARKATLLRPSEDADTHQGIDKLLQETAIDKEALTSTAADASRTIPPHDLSATTPERAYPLEKIILKGEWDYLKDILELLQNGKEINLYNYPSFVCNRVSRLDVIEDEAEKMRRFGILSYITHLVNFKDQHSLDGFSSSKQHKIPSMLKQKFSKMFVDSDKGRLSDEKIGSLVSYVLVLTMFIDEFETDFVDIARDLKMSAMKLRPYLENLGCQFKTKNKVTMAILPVPLKFPTLRKRRRRG